MNVVHSVFFLISICDRWSNFCSFLNSMHLFLEAFLRKFRCIIFQFSISWFFFFWRGHGSVSLFFWSDDRVKAKCLNNRCSQYFFLISIYDRLSNFYRFFKSLNLFLEVFLRKFRRTIFRFNISPPMFFLGNLVLVLSFMGQW